MKVQKKTRDKVKKAVKKLKANDKRRRNTKATRMGVK